MITLKEFCREQQREIIERDQQEILYHFRLNLIDSDSVILSQKDIKYLRSIYDAVVEILKNDPSFRSNLEFSATAFNAYITTIRRQRKFLP